MTTTEGGQVKKFFWKINSIYGFLHKNRTKKTHFRQRREFLYSSATSFIKIGDF